MEQITYYVNTQTVTGNPPYEGDHQTIKLVLDFTETDYEDWPKFVDFIIPGNVPSFKSLGSDTIVNYIMTNAELKTGTLYIQPYAKLPTGETKRFSIYNLKVDDSLVVITDMSVITQDILDFLNTQLNLKVDKVAGKSLIADSAITDLTDGNDTSLHVHDSRYYTESEVDGLLGNKVDKITGYGLISLTDPLEVLT